MAELRTRTYPHLYQEILMLTVALRLYFALVAPSGARAAIPHELAHRACEIAVYAVVAPDAEDDATTPLGETISEALCRGEFTLPGQTDE